MKAKKTETEEVNGQKVLLTVEEACNVLSIGRTLLYGLCKAGTVKTVRVGTRGVRIPRTEIDRFVLKNLERD